MSNEKLRGVNLGGWLLLEKWMTPSLFAGVDAIDEYTFMQSPSASSKLDEHRKTFITESDFRWLKENGINAVRIPIGYWALEDSHPFISSEKYLDWAMDMAKKYSLHVIIDVHGLIGSQNGRDHSGKVGRSEWFNRRAYFELSLTMLERIAKRYKDYDNFWGLQIINEPKLGVFHLTLRSYYKKAYSRLSKILKPHTAVIYSDAFTPRFLSGALRRSSQPVVMDVHIYHMTTLFSKYLNVDTFLRKIKNKRTLLARLSKKQPVIIGEWSGAMRHETMRIVPTNAHEDLMKRYIQIQLETYESAAGWFYWNYKTEKPGVWNFRSLVESGIVNLDHTER